MNFEEILTLVNTFLVAFFSVLNVRVALKLFKETKLLRQNYVESCMVAYLTIAETDPSLVYLNIENVGQGLATDVICKVIKDINYSENYQNFNNKELENLGIFQVPIKFIPSKHKNKYLLFSLSVDHERMIQEHIVFQISYNNGLIGISEEIRLDFKNISGLSMVTPPDNYLGQISYRLEKIENLIEKKIRLDSNT